MLTRKDYRRLAQLLYNNLFMGTYPHPGVLVLEFADWLKQDNPRFDREKFIDACLHGEGK